MSGEVLIYWVLYEHGNGNQIVQKAYTNYIPDLTTFPSHVTYAEVTKSQHDDMEYYLEYAYNSNGTITEINHDQNMAAYQRDERNKLLAETDRYAVADGQLTDEMRTYRQALRDVPQQSGFPDNITWPTKP